MVIFSMQQAWWQVPELRWALICHLKKLNHGFLDLTDIATRISSPSNQFPKSAYHYTDRWSRKQWRKVYKRIPEQVRLVFEKNLQTVARFKKLSFKPFLIRRTKAQNV